MINGREYAFGDIALNWLGRVVIGFTAVKYSDNQSITLNYGAGNYPQSYTKGQYKAEASITLQTKELIALDASIPGGLRFQDIGPNDMVVTMGNDGAPSISDVIHIVGIENNGRDWKQQAQAGAQEIEIKLVVSTIDWGQQ